jgi:hypothetical protein
VTVLAHATGPLGLAVFVGPLVVVGLFLWVQARRDARRGGPGR